MKAWMPLAVFVSGAGIALTLAPFHLWWLAFPCLALFAWQLQQSPTPKKALKTGWLFGFGLNLASVCWVFVSINEHSNTPLVLSLAFTLLFCAFLGLLYGLFSWGLIRYANSNWLTLLLGFPSMMVLQEFFKGWFLTGFPWPFIGYSQIDSSLAGFAPLFGVNGLSFISCFIAALLVVAFQKPRWQQGAAIVVVIFIFIAGHLLQKIDWSTPTERKTTVSLVQANTSQDIKWVPDYFESTINNYMTLSMTEWPKGGLVIWPESAIAQLYERVEETTANIASHAEQFNGGFITGVLSHEFDESNGNVDYYNSIMGFANASGIYNKRHLVPFGEVVPFEKLLKPLGSIFALPMSSFSRGMPIQEPLVFNGIRFSPYICYEIIFPRYIIRDFADTDVLLTISNDTWFGKSHGPAQHVQMAQMRALESARYLVRANNNGFSVIVDSKGKIIKRSKKFKQDVISGEVIAMEGVTPFMKFGQWPALVFSLLGCLICCLYIKLKPEINDNKPPP